MKPIISPFMFYLANTSENLMIISIFLVAGLGITSLLLAIDERPSKKCFIGFIISVLILVLAPSRSVCYQMMAASMMTPDNIEIVGNSAEDIIDYIIESVDTLLEESK